MAEETYPCPWCEREVPIGPGGCPYCAKKQKKAGRKMAEAKVVRFPKKKRKREPREEEEDWSYLDGVDLPDDSFDEEVFRARERGGEAPHRQIGIKWYWWLVAAGLVILMFWTIFSQVPLF